MNRYIITGDGMMAHPFKSNMNWMEFNDFIQVRTLKIHPNCRDTVFRWGTIEFINPQVKTPDDFSNFMPGLL